MVCVWVCLCVFVCVCVCVCVLCMFLCVWVCIGGNDTLIWKYVKLLILIFYWGLYSNEYLFYIYITQKGVKSCRNEMSAIFRKYWRQCSCHFSFTSFDLNFHYSLTLSCIMLKTGQTYFKSLVVFTKQKMFGHFPTLCMQGSINKDQHKEAINISKLPVNVQN